MSKFEPLTRFLSTVRAEECRVTFKEIEELLGFKLPPSSRRHRPWWSNNPSNSAITQAWLLAGFKTEQVDMAGEKLVFRRLPASAAKEVIPGTRQLRQPLFGALKGTVQIAPGTDLTEPTGERWNADEGRL